MKIVVIGYSKMFAAIIDAVLQSRHELVGVLRHDRIRYNPLKLFFKDIINPSNDISLIKSKKLKEIKVTSVNSKKFKKKIEELQPDIIFVCSWSEKIKKEIFEIPKIGVINIHPSLLPKYRGSNPYAWVLFNGEKVTGVTFHLVSEKWDAGPVLMQKSFKILDTDDGLSLKNKAASIANVMCTTFLEKTADSIIMPTVQNEKDATYFPALTYKDMVLDFSKSTECITRQIRGLYPWAKSFIECNGRFLEVRKYLVTDNKDGAEPRSIVNKSGRDISVATIDGKIIHFFDVKLLKTIFMPSTRLFIKYGIGDKI